MNVAVIGAGSWGTALALVLADNGHQVKLWTRRREQAEELNKYHTNEMYLPKRTIPASIVATTDIENCVRAADYILLVVPTQAMRETVKKVSPFIPQEAVLIHASKGIEPDTHLRVSEMIAEELPDESKRQIVVLSGPSHAEEVSDRKPTTVTVSSTSIQLAEKVQDLFMNHYFRVYTNKDIIGVEIGGALKNIIALGIGLNDGLGYGDNAKAALMTRGLAEIVRLGVNLGANPLTFTGLTGLGDLIVTCTSQHSRNWRAGYKIGSGKSVTEVLEEMDMVVEGIRTTKAVHELSKRLQVDMPITNALYTVLFEDASPVEAAQQLMKRGRKQEEEHLSLLFDKNN